MTISSGQVSLIGSSRQGALAPKSTSRLPSPRAPWRAKGWPAWAPSSSWTVVAKEAARRVERRRDAHPRAHAQAFFDGAAEYDTLRDGLGIVARPASNGSSGSGALQEGSGLRRRPARGRDARVCVSRSRSGESPCRQGTSARDEHRSRRACVPRSRRPGARRRRQQPSSRPNRREVRHTQSKCSSNIARSRSSAERTAGASAGHPEQHHARHVAVPPARSGLI